jgi:hypothetical protein
LLSFPSFSSENDREGCNGRGAGRGISVYKIGPVSSHRSARSTWDVLVHDACQRRFASTGFSHSLDAPPSLPCCQTCLVGRRASS